MTRLGPDYGRMRKLAREGIKGRIDTMTDHETYELYDLLGEVRDYLWATMRLRAEDREKEGAA